MTEQYLSLLTWFVRALFFLSAVGVLLALAWLWDGYQERKFTREMDWDDELEALARIYENPAAWGSR